MRGKEENLSHDGTAWGITPAYAGKSTDAKLFHGIAEDHPRLCGEKFLPQTAAFRPARITPAYAGKSSSHAINTFIF